MNIIFRTGPSGLDARAKVVREIRATVHPPPTMRATPSGLAVVGVGLLDNLEANRVDPHVHRDPVRVPVPHRAAPKHHSGAAVARAGVDRGRCVVAVRVHAEPQAEPDDRRRRAAGGRRVHRVHFVDPVAIRGGAAARPAPRQAMDVAAARTGRAFIVSALTAISGVAVIATSSLPLLHDFGQIVALNVAIALLSALVVLPPMLVWADRRNWVSRGLVPADLLAGEHARSNANEAFINR